MERVLLEGAVRILRGGGLVAFPTETVYGLGADASNPAAVRRIFEAKGRPTAHPLIVHLATEDQIGQWAHDIPAAASQLASAFWPGPMTLILKRHARVLDEVTGGQDTVGLRVPAHPMAQALLQAFGGGVAAPSANRFGHVSPTTAAHVRDELGGRVDLVLDGGACDVGIESTIVDCSSGIPFILRPGKITGDDIRAATGLAPNLPTAAAPRVSGSLASHYAPSTPVVLVPSAALDEVARSMQAPLAVLARRPRPGGWERGTWREAPSEPEGYARALYAHLRELDRLRCNAILVEEVPPGMAWSAIADRLSRAAGKGSDLPDSG
ncbi:MAG: threonylcarbamoyl-AMP synthase [Betaproteobacteria bacterium]|nr:threonylcarbamoyl-AMP synthase [Betaproteobacteria bacterium]